MLRKHFNAECFLDLETALVDELGQYIHFYPKRSFFFIKSLFERKLHLNSLRKQCS